MSDFQTLIDELTDDQITELARVAILAMVNRSAATREAAAILMIDAAERKRILENADDDERRALRAKERIELDRQARELARAEAEARLASEKERIALALAREWLETASGLLDAEPRKLRIVRLERGARILIERADAQFGDHIVDWRSGVLRTDRRFMARKPEIAAFCARLSVEMKNREINGRDYFAE